jgi:hypothetical protein
MEAEHKKMKKQHQGKLCIDGKVFADENIAHKLCMNEYIISETCTHIYEMNLS